MFDRIKYGRIFETGKLTLEKRTEFRHIFSNYDFAQVTAIFSYCAIPPISPYVHEKRNETSRGDNSWQTMESNLEEMTRSTNTPINKIPFFFRHRKKKGKDCVEIMACGRHVLGSHHIYSGRVIST